MINLHIKDAHLKKVFCLISLSLPLSFFLSAPSLSLSLQGWLFDQNWAAEDVQEHDRRSDRRSIRQVGEQRGNKMSPYLITTVDLINFIYMSWPIVSRYDRNHDGRLDFDEFKDLMVSNKKQDK